MGHAITYNSITNQYEVMTRGTAWHHLGQVVTDAQTCEETMVKAGLDWTVSKRQLQFNGLDVPVWGIFRDDLIHTDLGSAFLAPSTEGYELIQNRYMFAFLDTMIEQDGKAHYEAAGSLSGGAQVFAVVNLGIAFEIGGNGDRFETYLVFVEDRTGKKAAACFITTVRIVCANTFEQAYSGMKKDQAVRFIHTKSVAERMADASGLFTGARMDLDLLKAKLERLSEVKMTKPSLQAILNGLFPVEDETKVNKRREDKQIEIVNLYAHNDDNQFPAIRGTAYNIWNAVNEYIDHYKPVKVTASRRGMTEAQIRSQAAVFDSATVAFKANALDMILDVTANNPTMPKRIYSTPSGKEFVEVGIDAAGDDDSILDADLVG